MKTYIEEAIRDLITERAVVNELSSESEEEQLSVCDDIDLEFSDGKALQDSLKNMGYPLRTRGYHQEMDKYWEFTPSRIENQPIKKNLQGLFYCTVANCSFKSGYKNLISRHITEKHPVELHFFFEWPKFVLPFIAKDINSIINLFKNEESFKPSRIKSIHISQIKYGYLCPKIHERFLSDICLMNVLCDERKIAHKFILKEKDKKKKLKLAKEWMKKEDFEDHLIEKYKNDLKFQNNIKLKL